MRQAVIGVVMLALLAVDVLVGVTGPRSSVHLTDLRGQARRRRKPAQAAQHAGSNETGQGDDLRGLTRL